MSVEHSSPLRRPRVSLLSLLLLTGLVGASLTTAMLWREVGPLRQEVEGYRAEAGDLRILPKQAHVAHSITAKTRFQDEWRVRVYVPEGSSYRLYCACEMTPPFAGGDQATQRHAYLEGAAAQMSDSRIDSGEHLFWVRCDEVVRDKLAVLRVRISESSSGREWSFLATEWPMATVSGLPGPQGTPRTHTPEEPIHLMRAAMPTNALPALAGDLAPAVEELTEVSVAVWLDPVKRQTRP